MSKVGKDYGLTRKKYRAVLPVRTAVGDYGIKLPGISPESCAVIMVPKVVKQSHFAVEN